MPRYLEKQYNTYHVTLYIPKDVQHRFGGKKRFCKSLQTDSRAKADVLKHPYLAEWKALIEAARSTKGDFNSAAVREQAHLLKHEIKTHWEGWEDDGLMELAESLRQHPDQDYADELINVVSGDWTATADFVDQWLKFQEYQDKTADEARSSVKKFTTKFKYFENVSQAELKNWISELLVGLSDRTVKKKLGFVRGYWQYCYENELTKATPPEQGLVKARKAKTKVAVTREYETRRVAWTDADYFRLLNAAKTKGDQTLTDLIVLGAYTGMRLEEIASMRLANVTNDRFKVVDAKSAAGWRDIPIHAQITDLVDRLVEGSADGYLLSGLTLDKYGDRGSAIGKRFGRLKSKLDYDQTKVFHCFRKTLAFKLRDAGVLENQAALILGHEIDSITYGTYGEDISFQRKVEIMALVSYKPS